MNRKPLGNPGQLPISGRLRLPALAACGDVWRARPQPPAHSLPQVFDELLVRPVCVASRSFWLLS